MRVATVVGTRPEIIRLSRVIAALDKAVDHTLIHTGQNYDHELKDVFFEEMGIRQPDVTLNIKAARPSEFVGMAMMLLQHPLEKLNPDAILILGDTNSCLAAAYVAKRLKIPLFHMEAGNRSYDERVPEEVNRKMIDHIADINLPYSTLAREALIREGIPADRVIKTGSPMAEVIEFYNEKIRASQVLSQLNLTYRDYFVVSCHREENVDTPEKFQAFLTMLRGLSKANKRIIVSAHPRIFSKLTTWGGDFSNTVEIHKPFGFFDYAWLQCNAMCTLSDSGTITEESSILGFPALNLRESHERPEGMEEAAVILTDFSQAINKIPAAIHFTPNVPHDYTQSNVAEKVVRIILSYTDYVNKKVWRK